MIKHIQVLRLAYIHCNKMNEILMAKEVFDSPSLS